ncbi:MAG: PDR/VanB family oxidoreductase [Comamonas sp.]
MIAHQSLAEARVAGLRDVTPSVREFLLAPLDGAVLPHEPGAHLQVRVDGWLRHYSLVGEARPAHYRIAVKRQDDGLGGSRALWRLKVGDRLQIGTPRNHFPLALQAPAYLLVAGGIGITPLVFMAQRLARLGREVRMAYAARTPEDMAYADELRPLLGESLRCLASAQGQRLDVAAEIAVLPPGGQLYACGPLPLLDALRAAWRAAGRPEADLRFETFGSGGAQAAHSFQVAVPRHGLAITVPVGTSLLDALEASGVEALHDCRRGECGLCVMDVLALDGEIDHRDVFLSPAEKQENRRICACVSRAVGAITLDTAYRADVG